MIEVIGTLWAVAHVGSAVAAMALIWAYETTRNERLFRSAWTAAGVFATTVAAASLTMWL